MSESACVRACVRACVQTASRCERQAVKQYLSDLLSPVYKNTISLRVKFRNICSCGYDLKAILEFSYLLMICNLLLGRFLAAYAAWSLPCSLSPLLDTVADSLFCYFFECNPCLSSIFLPVCTPCRLNSLPGRRFDG